jgi:hypothetical protein
MLAAAEQRVLVQAVPVFTTSLQAKVMPLNGSLFETRLFRIS